MSRFRETKPGVIYDHESGLEWMVGEDKDTSWPQAKAWVATIAGSDGKWRMPTIKELQSICQPDGEHFTLPKEFKLSESYVWSGDEHSPSTAWAYFFPLGSADWSTRTAACKFRAMAVRKKG